MKKLLSLMLALIMLISVAVIFPSTASAAQATFNEGDILYMKIISPAEWTGSNAIMYANFTEYSRADNGGSSVILAEADKSKYDPRTGVEYDAERGVYKYTVTAQDAGKTAMRFWRGNDIKLWNCSILLTADDFANGYNMVTIDGFEWDDSGEKLTYYDLAVEPKLTLSSKAGDIGDTITVTVELDEVENVNYTYEIKKGNEVVTNEKTYSFTATENGAYSFTVNVTATNDNGKVLGMGTDSSTVTIGVPAVTGAISAGLYAHAYSADSKESEAWVKWYNKDNVRHFLMPTCTNANTIEIYNNYSTDAVINGVTIAPQTIGVVNYEEGREYSVSANNKTYTAKFMISSAEAAIFINNPSDFNGNDLWSYLTDDKENYASATAAALDDEGNLDSTPIKKIKGRGNTSWQAEKKGFNLNYDSAISLDGMQKCKKFSIISNFQDPALARNRILYDLADEIGVPYASDSRFAEVYVNGDYIGNYMVCEKVDVGKNTLIPDVDEEDYLNYVSGAQENFSFVCEIDNAPSADDFSVTMGNKNKVTMKSPELEKSDSNYNAVKNYIINKYDTMWDKIASNAADVNDYIDIESLAQVYLINEFGKNWDSGAGSFYFVYKPDQSGHYKFFASPVWDYDNSLGNANGVSDDLRNLGISDYTLPTGWFSKLKNGYSGPNFLTDSIKNCGALNEIIPTVWFEQFVPAIENKLNGTGLDNTELYSSDVYYSYLKDSADLNYVRWDMVTDTGWIANHTSLKKSYATYTYNEYGQVTDMTYRQDSKSTSYTKYDFKAEFDYMIDWANSRAAWLSDQYFSSYTPSEIIPTEPETEPTTQPPTEPVLPDEEPKLDLENAIAAWQFDPTGKVEEDKLTEYGSGDEGYQATYGNGKLIGTVDGVNMRSLEWSAVEYGTNGLNMVPLMAAGSKNLWCENPYVQFEISTKNYEDIHFTMYMAGSKKCPASWKVQYSIDGTTFVDVENAVATITMDNRKLMTAYLDNIALPSDIDNQDAVIIRLTPTSTTTVNSSTTDVDPSGGELALNNILISGTKIEAPVENIKGDADLDGEVTVLDATAIQKHCAQMLTLSEQGAINGDVNRDTKLNVLDATIIQKFLADIFDTL
ncbi:MAG: CotH kinase family protein [Ruminococcus sp.]|nr:CotH kinase family protein [Ruminococcus sp.]